MQNLQMWNVQIQTLYTGLNMKLQQKRTKKRKKFGQHSQWRVETVPQPVPDVFQDVSCTYVARHLRRLSNNYHTSQPDLWYLAISGLQDHCYDNFLSNNAWCWQTQIRSLVAIVVDVVRDTTFIEYNHWDWMMRLFGVEVHKNLIVIYLKNKMVTFMKILMPNQQSKCLVWANYFHKKGFKSYIYVPSVCVGRY